MAARGKALTYLLTALGGIAGALLGFIVTGRVAYGLLGLAGMVDREGGPHSRVLGTAGACIFSNGRRSRGGRRAMQRVEGVDPGRVTDEYTAKVLAAQARTWGVPLLNHLMYARRPTIFRGARGMWTCPWHARTWPGSWELLCWNLWTSTSFSLSQLYSLAFIR